MFLKRSNSQTFELYQGIHSGIQTFPWGCAPRGSMRTLGNSLGQIFQTTTKDFPLFVPYICHIISKM